MSVHAKSYGGPKCPVDPEHGPLLALDNYGWYCPHRAHEGRPSRHPAGEAPRTRALFRTAEVEWS